ncbi:hypothetical protein ACH41H_36425 [Streptomyces sp. NPDC020800]|uniref:hypothetical protein n=1 Tax=Streptomyces sp. NPDC020800 TaxID=3365092 RepID=UPI0037AEEFE6
MSDEHLITVQVSTELAEDFEAHAHLLAPARIVRKDTDGHNPFWCTSYLHHPSAPPGAVSMCPVWQQTRDGVRLFALDWYDPHGRPVPGPDAGPAHGTAQ